MTPPSERAEPIRDEDLARLYQFETAIKSVDGPVVRGLLARITTQAEAIRRLEGEVALQARFAEQHAERSFELEQRAEAAEGLLVEVVMQACSVGETLDSFALSSYAEAIRFLAERGKVRITKEYGRRVIATPATGEGEG